MARITVEDCVRVVPNRFELCLLSSNRAKAILSGSETTCQTKEKPAVISLREIADGTVNIAEIKNDIIRNIKESQNSSSSSVDFATKEQVKDVFADEGEMSMQNTSANFVSENINVED